MRAPTAVGLALVVACAACDEAPTIDGAVPADGSVGDLGPPPDANAAVTGGFTVLGCASLDQRDPVRCTGAAPLTLTFVPLAAGADTYVWTFSGATPAASSAQTPTVVYPQPGTFQVMLAAGGAGGTLSSMGTIIVGTGGTGAPCMNDADCDGASGLTCVCGAGGCPGGLAVGICTRPCGGGDVCAAGEVCADLARGYVPPPPVDGGSDDGGVQPMPWRRALCLPACSAAADCRAGLRCREVPALLPGALSGGAYAWKKACFADALGDDGEACAAPDGQPAPDQCLSGRCDALGARDLCTSDCTTTGCPSYAACVTFNGTPSKSQCLYRCDPAKPVCPSGDPLLDCEPPGRAGGLGFSVPASEPVGATYCAPRRCSGPADCAPAGTCTAFGAGSFCTKQ